MPVLLLSSIHLTGSDRFVLSPLVYYLSLYFSLLLSAWKVAESEETIKTPLLCVQLANSLDKTTLRTSLKDMVTGLECSRLMSYLYCIGCSTFMPLTFAGVIV